MDHVPAAPATTYPVNGKIRRPPRHRSWSTEGSPRQRRTGCEWPTPPAFCGEACCGWPWVRGASSTGSWSWRSLGPGATPDTTGAHQAATSTSHTRPKSLFSCAFRDRPSTTGAPSGRPRRVYGCRTATFASAERTLTTGSHYCSRRPRERFGTAPDGRLFTGERNHGELPKLTIVRAWKRARQEVFIPEVAASPLAGTPYDLRHAAASTWLNGGIPPTQVAEWAGHSVEILLKIYAKCLDGGQEHLRARVQAALGY